MNDLKYTLELSKKRQVPTLELQLYRLTGEEPHLYMLKEMPWLKSLDLSRNQIVDIYNLATLILNDLPCLTTLKLSSNQIADISPLSKLMHLTHLEIDFNRIIDVSVLRNFTGLTHLNLRGNQIQDITPLVNLDKIRILYLNNNPVFDKLPNEIQNKASKIILQYWKDTYNRVDTPKPLREAKVVFVGEGGVGKTSLMRKLLYGNEEEPKRTEKIEIHTNDTLFTYGTGKEHLKLRFWDFGGQDIMHATHKFFMSSRTLYVLVVHGRKDETDTLQNWIEMLRSSIEDSPVLLVVNHLDEDKDKHRLGDYKLKADFDNLRLPLIETSWQTGRGLNKLKEAIQSELQKMPHFQQDFSIIYQSIKEELENVIKPYITYQEYQQVCSIVSKRKGESKFEQESQKILADFLNDLGVMLNFRKKSDKLEDLLIFKPAWIVDGVYQIINAEETQAQKGKIHEETVGKLLRGIGYSNNTERDFILNMMKHFKLAYQQQENVGKYCYLIPSLFDKNPPASFSAWQASSGEGLLRVRFQYEIWRNDYISYFLVTQHTHTIAGTHWATGAILQYGEQQARIEAVRYQKHIDIQIAGKQDKRYALWRIREALAQVHAMFDEAKLGISMWVIHEEAGKEDEFEYDYLKVALEEGETQIFSKVFRKKLSIPALLEGVSLNQSETKEALQKALAYLEKGNLTGYFAEMDKVEKDFQQNITYSQLKNDFVNGEKSSYFAERLGTFAKLFV